MVCGRAPQPRDPQFQDPAMTAPDTTRNATRPRPVVLCVQGYGESPVRYQYSSALILLMFLRG